MTIIIANHRYSQNVQRQYKDAVILDVTSNGPQPWVRFSPFYPHGNIPVPFSPGLFSQTVEGIWQGLKVFEHMDVDPSKFRVTNMKGIKRSASRYGGVLGHREGVNGEELLPYLDARWDIYLPSYIWVLDHCLQAEVQQLKQLAEEKTVVLLDFETNCNINDVSRPLSHASLIKRYVEGEYPE